MKTKMENNISNQTLHNKTNYNFNNDPIYIIVKVEFYCSIVILSFGSIGNLISLLIFTRPNLNKKTNTGILYSLICFVCFNS